MRKLLLVSLMVGAFPLLCLAKGGTAIPAGKQQLHFVENKGQVHDQNYQPRTDIQFSIPGKDMSLFIGNGQLHYQFYRKDKEGYTPGKEMKDMGKKPVKAQYTLYRMDVELVGANAHAPAIKEGPQKYVERHILGNSTRVNARNAKGLLTAEQSIEAHSFNKVTYKDVYPNIDWVIYTNDNQVKYDFVVRAGGNPSDIKIKYKGATSTKLNEAGGIVANTPLGTVTESAPYSYQEDGREVASSFKLENDVLTFNVAQYSGTLVIDPSIDWGTYFGGSGDEEYNGISYVSSTALYVAGNSNSLVGMATFGSHQEFLEGGDDAVVSRFETNGDLQWSTYFGFLGSSNEVINSIDWDPVNQVVYALGQTDANFDLDALLLSFDQNGNFGGNFVIGVPGDDEQGFSAKCNPAGNLYICGSTTSLADMGSIGSVQEFSAGGFDGWIWKFDNTGTLEWGTYYGGPGNENLSSVSTDAGGDVYASGTTNSTTDISTLNSYGGGTFDAYATRISADGTGWVWGRYFGGSGQDESLGSEVDGTGNLYITGVTGSTGLGSGGFQNTLGGGTDAFVAKLSNSGAVTWSSYFGGSGLDQAHGICLNGTGVYIGGYSQSSNLAATTGFQTTFGGVGDGFMANITAAGVLTWASYYGGTGDEAVNSVATDNTAAYCAGITSSTTGIAFNTTLQPTKDLGFDAFITKINECTLPGTPGTITGSASVCAGSTQTYSITAVTGATSYTWTLPVGWTGTSTTNSITVTVGTTGGTISVTPTNACGNSTAATLAVTVNPIPTATITPAGPTTFCQGGSVVLNANTGAGFSYAWFEGANPVGTNTSSFTANASGSYTVQITANGCSATSTAVSVTVNPTPDATASSNSAVCVGQTLNLNGGSTTAGATYSWAGPAFTSSLEDPTIPNAQAANAGVYTLTVTANGCTQTATTTVVVTNTAPAAPATINGDITICANSTGNIYDVTNDPNAATYNWTLPAGWSGTSTTNSITATSGAAGTVTISVSAENGCGTSAATLLSVTVNASPVVNITQNVNTLTAPAGFASYQWYDGSGLIAGATNATFNATGNGTYYCIVTDANGCTGQSNSINVAVGVNSIAKQSSVNLYPNPNNGSFIIEGAFASNDGKANVVIVDIAGRIVHQEQVAVTNDKLNVHMDMNSALAAGVYTIKVSSDAANAVIPFVKK